MKEKTQKKHFYLKIKVSLIEEYLQVTDSDKFKDLEVMVNIIDQYSDRPVFLIILDENDNIVFLSKNLRRIVKDAAEIFKENKESIFKTSDKYLYRKLKENRIRCKLIQQKDIKNVKERDFENVLFGSFSKPES